MHPSEPRGGGFEGGIDAQLSPVMKKGSLRSEGNLLPKKSSSAACSALAVEMSSFLQAPPECIAACR